VDKREYPVDECRTTMTRRAVRRQWKHCACGCGDPVLMVREFLSPDGVRWVLNDEQYFIPVGRKSAVEKIPVDMEAGKA